MSLDPVLLDDLTWREMVDVIRSRIAAVSAGEWTLHAPVDPGITLLELFASQFEQRSYWLDQVPDALLNGLVGLLGGMPRPARAARTVFELAAPGGEVPADTVFALVGDPLLRMATGEAVSLLSPAVIDLAGPFGTRRLAADSQPRWSMQPLTLLPAGGAAGEVAITLWLSNPPAMGGAPFALLFELDAALGVRPGWDAEAVADVPPPASLAWSVSEAGGRRRLGVDAVGDGTGSLRRSGLVRLAPGAGWAPSGPAENGLTPYTLWLTCEEGTFSAPPQMRACVPDVVSASHSIPVELAPGELADQFAAWLPLPGRTIALQESLPPLEDTVELTMRHRDDVRRTWRMVSDFARSGPEDPVFLVDRAFNCLRFGDGLTGRLPVPGAPLADAATLRYRAGGGVAGNVGSHRRWEGASAGLVATNAVAATGGTESETTAEMQLRVGSEHLSRRRAVTLADIEELATATPGGGVARAHAIAGYHPGFPCTDVPGAIGVFILPDVPRGDGWQESDRRVDAPLPDPGMLAAARAWLEPHRLLTSEIFVLAPAYRAVEARARLHGAPVDRTAVNARLREGLAQYLDALVGGAEGGGWDFGGPLRTSEIAHRLQELAGDDIVVDGVGLRLSDGEGAFDECDDLVLARNELPRMAGMAIDWSAPPAQRGGLS